MVASPWVAATCKPCALRSHRFRSAALSFLLALDSSVSCAAACVTFTIRARTGLKVTMKTLEHAVAYFKKLNMKVEGYQL